MAEKDLGHLGTYDTDSHTVSGPLGRLTVDRDGSVKDLGVAVPAFSMPLTAIR